MIKPGCKTKEVTECYIYSMVDNSKVSGSFALGCGSIEEKDYYIYFYKTINGTLSRGKIDCNHAEIKFTTGKPRITSTKRYYDEGSIEAILLGEEIDDYKIIYLPKESVINNINIDLQ